jgi:hypothetical protein
MRLRHLVGLFAVLPFAVGCNGGPPSGPPSDDPSLVALAVSRVNDDKSSPSVLVRSFAAGSAPKDLKKYSRYAYEVDGRPTITGPEASATVKLIDERTQKEVGTQQWLFVKEGDVWKVKSAPLP